MDKSRILSADELNTLSAISANTKIAKTTRDRAQTLLDSHAELALSRIEEENVQRAKALKQEALAVKEADIKRESGQKRCSHLKKDPLTGARNSHLRGQSMEGGILVLVCQGCGKVFSDPPRPSERWEAIPANLYPDSSGIGAINNPKLQLQAARMMAIRNEELRKTQDAQAAEADYIPEEPGDGDALNL